MPTKSELIAQANREFPEHWEMVRRQNRALRLPERTSFPSVTRITTGEVTHKFGTETALTLELVREDGSSVTVQGMNFKNHHGHDAAFSSAPEDLQLFLLMFVNNFYGNIICIADVELENWNLLPE